MTTARYAVFLRAVNGSPHNRLSMSNLRTRITGYGFTDVSSHLATGNIALTDPQARAPAAVAVVLEDRLKRSDLVRVDAMVWAPQELLSLSTGNWFADHPETEWRRCASFLRAPPGRDGTAAVQSRGAAVVHATTA